MDSLLHEALQTPREERLALIEALWNSLVDELEQSVAVPEATRAELDRRLQALEEQPDATVPWAVLRDSLSR